jgi:hypothetical protein
LLATGLEGNPTVITFRKLTHGNNAWQVGNSNLLVSFKRKSFLLDAIWHK